MVLCLHKDRRTNGARARTRSARLYLRNVLLLNAVRELAPAGYRLAPPRRATMPRHGAATLARHDSSRPHSDYAPPHRLPPAITRSAATWVAAAGRTPIGERSWPTVAERSVTGAPRGVHCPPGEWFTGRWCPERVAVRCSSGRCVPDSAGRDAGPGISLVHRGLRPRSRVGPARADSPAAVRYGNSTVRGVAEHSRMARGRSNGGCCGGA